MPTTAELSAKHRKQSERVRAWLRPLMENGRPKMATKEELWSVSEWATEGNIAAYLDNAAHKEIVRHARSLKGSKAVVKLYDLVE